MSFQLSGNTHSVALPVVLEMLQTAGVTGVLTVNVNAFEKCVHFKEGQIIFAVSNDPRDRLGEMLVKSGLLSRESLEEALLQYNKNAGIKKMGAILVENGVVSPKDLFACLKMQIKEIIYSLFLMKEAEYHFDDRVVPDVIHLQLNLAELVPEIIARIKRET